MKNAIAIIVALLCAGVHVGKAQKILRKDAFLGFAFDFHATEMDTMIGRGFRPGIVDTLLNMTKPDFIQVDSKGNTGISSYPTQVGKRANKIRADIMQVWRDVTNAHNVDLIVHFSGLIDVYHSSARPDWAAHNADGSIDSGYMSPSSPYVDNIVIPQLKELAAKYKIEGAWIDGDTWAAQIDYSPAIESAFTKATGITNIPAKPSDPHYQDYIAFNQAQYKKYVKHYVDALHQANPSFEIANDWAFSSYMPEPVDIPLDFLSGDVSGEAVFGSAFFARCFAHSGKPWELMNWGVARTRAPKPFPQIAQEVSETLAMGGATETYWPQYHDGNLAPNWFPTMAQLAQFCRDRQPYCFHGQIVPQIALVYSTYAWKQVVRPTLYSTAGSSGLTLTLNYPILERQRSAEVLMDYQLPELAQNYPLIIYPQWSTIDQATRDRLVEYVKNGGNLLVIGANASAAFKDQLGIQPDGGPVREVCGLAYKNGNYGLTTTVQPVKVTDPAIQTFGNITNRSGQATTTPLATVSTLGKGKLGLIYFDIASFYTSSPVVSSLMDDLIDNLFPTPLVTVKNANHIHVVDARKDGHLFIHLINSGGPHDDPKIWTYDKVPGIGAFELDVRASSKPHSVLLQPGNQSLSFDYSGGVIKVQVPKLDIYSIVQID